MVVTWDDIGTELRIERADFLDGHVQYLGNLCEMDAAVHTDRIGDERFAGQRRADVVLLVIGHRIVGSDKARSTVFLGADGSAVLSPLPASPGVGSVGAAVGGASGADVSGI